MEIRNFQEKDVKGVNALISSIFKNEYSEESTAYPDDDLKSIPKIYGGPREAFFIIEDDGNVVATVGIKEDSKPVALMRRLFVDSRYRSKGLGSSLVYKVIEFCRQKGYKKIVFRSTDRMQGANSLCLKKGFKEQERFDFGNVQIVKYELEL